MRRAAKPRLFHAATEALEQRMLLSDSGGAASLLGTMPAVFVENRGQWADPSVRYALQTPRANVLMTDDGPVFQVFGADGKSGSLREQFFAEFENANTVRPQGSDAADSKFNFYVGDESQWRTNVSGYEKVGYKGLYDGIDLYTWGKRSSLKYEFHVAPGADYSQIQVNYSGIDGLSIDSKGRLHIATPLGELVDDAPVVYQLVNGKRVAVEASFLLVDSDSYTFQLNSAYDPTKQLIIDPDVEWATFLGGTAGDNGFGVAMDTPGNSYVTGSTSSVSFPVIGGFDSNLDVPTDAFVAKFDPDGDLLWSSFLGGNASDIAYDIDVDSDSNPHVVGVTSSTDFPTNGGFQLGFGGMSDGFITKINTNGTITWSSYLGGASTDEIRSVALDTGNNAYVTGTTWSSDFDTTVGLDRTLGGDTDAFVTRISSDPQIVWSTYLGGEDLTAPATEDWDMGSGIALTNTGTLSVVGSTTSRDSLATPGAFDTTYNGGQDAFIATFDLNGERQWVTYLGGSGMESGNAIAVDSPGNIAVVGSTTSASFPLLQAFDTTRGGTQDAFVSRFDVAGVMTLSSYFGGGLSDTANSVAIDGDNNVVMVGFTLSTDLPAGSRAGFDTTYGGAGDGFIAVVADDNILDWTSYMGGSNRDSAADVAVHILGNYVVIGDTESNDFPSLNGFDMDYNGGGDVFLTRIDALAFGVLPFAPFGLRATPRSMTQIDLTWNDNSDNETGFYVVRRLPTDARYRIIATLGVNTENYSDRSVEPDTTYIYRVRAFNLFGDSAYSNYARATTRTAFLVAPSGLAATVISSKRIDLRWTDNSDNETGFEIWRQELPDGELELIATVGANSRTYRDETGLAADTEYSYQVRAVNAFRVSSFAGPVTATTRSADFVVAPSGLVAVVLEPGSNLLDWQDNSDNELGFTIERAPVGTDNWEEIASTFSNEATYQDDSADPDIIYMYRVRAFGSSQFSGYSNIATAASGNALAAPTRFEVQATGADRIALWWVDNAVIETAYVVERRRAGDSWRVVRTLPADTNGYTDRGLQPNSVYEYRIHATDGTNDSDTSRIASARTLGLLTSLPLSPSAFKGKALSPSSVQLWWRDNATDETSYLVERATSVDGAFAIIQTLPSNSSTYTDTTLRAGTDYWYRIRARRNDMTSVTSPILQISTPTPMVLTITASDPLGSEDGDVLRFTVRRKGGSTARDLLVNYDVSGTATDGKDYARLAGTVTIPAGEFSADIVIVPTNDRQAEDVETVVLSLAGNGSLYKVSPSLRSAEALIADNDIV